MVGGHARLVGEGGKAYLQGRVGVRVEEEGTHAEGHVCGGEEGRSGEADPYPFPFQEISCEEEGDVQSGLGTYWEEGTCEDVRGEEGTPVVQDTSKRAGRVRRLLLVAASSRSRGLSGCRAARRGCHSCRISYAPVTPDLAVRSALCAMQYTSK